MDEELGFTPSGDGGHDFLRVEKTGANTAWVAKALATHAGVPVRDIGYSGMKDRHAVTKQWYSVPHSPKKPVDWRTFVPREARICEQMRHDRKLRRGSHSANRFRIRIRCDSRNETAVNDRLAVIAESGVPNYFGTQRFGRNGNNLALAKAMFAGARTRRDKRGIALSAARSLLFNDVLSERTGAGNWNTVLPGDVLNLDGSGSIFCVEAVDEEIRARCLGMDIHPTGPLWGRGALRSSEGVAELERNSAAGHPGFVEGLVRFGLDMDRRALRLRVAALEWQWDEDGLELRFSLARGGYATSVLREVTRF